MQLEITINGSDPHFAGLPVTGLLNPSTDTIWGGEAPHFVCP
jgi:hypothetical protein